MRLLLFAAALPALFAADAPDPKEIVRRAVEADIRNDEIARNYTFIQRQEQRTRDGSGRVTKTESETWDVTVLEGTPYRRLIARNDKPLPPKELRKEEEKLRKSNEQRGKETEEQRNKRVAEWHFKRAEQREQAREIPEAFDFRLVSEERVGSVDAWMVEGLPRREYRPKSKLARMLLPKTRCRFWISKETYDWTRIELEALDTIPLGWVLVRIGKGSRMVVEQARVNDEVWMPRQVTVTANARVMLVKGMRIDVQVDFSNFRKFQTDSRIVSVEDKPVEQR